MKKAGQKEIGKVDEGTSEDSVVEPVVVDTLSADHFRQLEVMSRDIEVAKLQRTIRELELRLKGLEQKIIVFELESIQRLFGQAATVFEGKIKLRTALITDIKATYGISDSFGYDPETGRIVRG